MDIHHTSIKDFILPQIKSVVVIDYYEGIMGALSARKDFAYGKFLAKPRIRTKTEIIWATNVFRCQPVLLSDLSGDEKEYYALELKRRIEAIENLITTLNEEEAGTPLADILRKVIAYVDEQSVYCADRNVVLVNWGLIPRTANMEHGGIYRNGKFFGSWNAIQTHTARPQRISKDNQELPVTASGSGPLHHAEKGPVAQAEKIDAPKFTASSDTPHTVSPSEMVHPPMNHTVGDEIKTPDFKEKGNERKVADKLHVIEPSLEEVSPATPHPAIPEADAIEDNRSQSPKRNDSDKDSEGVHGDADWTWFFRTIKNIFFFFFRKLWWLLLILAALWALLFLTRGCQGPWSKVNPYYSPLPEHPRLLPVEDENVGHTPDSLIQIATDRLNIILEDASDENMLRWAKAFKKVYPGADYEVYFYNKELNLLQIKVPSSQQEKVKKEIKELIPDIPFDVTYEIVSTSSDASFNDPDFDNENHSWYLQAIGVYDAWRTTLGSDDVIVAVVDNGFDLTHPELQGKIVGPYNVQTQNDDIHPVYTADGESAHGTHVAATAVGNINNGTGLSGIAPKCRLMPVQVGNDNAQGCISNQAVIEGVLYAINNGADVVNVSLGFSASSELKSMSESAQLNFISSQMKYEEQLWNQVVEKARSRNCVIVVSAGNDDVISGIDPNKRNPSTIRVSAVTLSLQKASFSNYGFYPALQREYSTVSAPGVDIYNAAPHGRYMVMSGTSMASPVVAGVVALLKSENRNLTAEQIIDILKRTGRRIDKKIGPVVNVGNAMNWVAGRETNRDCNEIAQRLRRLQMEMDSLRRLCPDAGSESDTLKYDDAVKSKYGLDGVWKSTTSLVSTSDMSPIELYMEFSKLKGTLRICNKGMVYSAPLTAQIVNGKISIAQHSDAVCSKTPDTFCKYIYMCLADRFGNLQCRAKSNSNTVIFNLVKVK